MSLGAACRQVYAGYDATSNRTVLTATATGQGGSGYTYLWSNNATSPSITVSPATTTIYSVTVSKAGCSATGSVTVNVINVACEKNKVLICHNGLTLCVSKTGKNGVADHLAHGDKLGSCNTVLPCGSTGGRLAAYEPEAALSISLQANPIENGELRAIVRGVGGQPLTVQLHDVRGYVIRQQSWQQAEADQRIEWNLSTQSTGLYLLRAVSNSQQQTVKVLKP